MSTITKERVAQYANDPRMCNVNDEIRQIARIALASLEAENKLSNFVSSQVSLGGEFEKVLAENLHELYIGCDTAPPAPVSVPKDIPDSVFDVLSQACGGGGKACDFADELWNACRAAMLQGAGGKPELTVWYGSMPESNGKANWTAILHRNGEGRCMDGFTIDRSEYPGRVLYAADRVRYLIGEKSERPSILDYDADAHSGYVKPGNSPVIPDGWVACSERMPGEVLAALQNVARLRRNLNDFCGDKSLIAKCLSEAEGALLNAVNRHSTMLAEPLKEAKNV